MKQIFLMSLKFSRQLASRNMNLYAITILVVKYGDIRGRHTPS